jgi:hypothetical protein
MPGGCERGANVLGVHEKRTSCNRRDSKFGKPEVRMCNNLKNITALW